MTDRREQTATYVACFDANTGASRWVRYLGAASSEVDNFMRWAGWALRDPSPGDYGHRLLSLDGPFLYYQTNLGAVVALEAETGVVRWVANYPRQDSGRIGRQRPRSEPRGGARRAGHRRSQRCCRHLRVRRRQRAVGLEDRSHCRGGQAHSSSGRGQGAAGRHRRSGSALRRQDRQAGRHLARLGQVRRLRPRPAGRGIEFTGRPGTGSRSSTRAPVCAPSRRSS